MDVSKPFTAISPSVDVDVLVVLAGSTKPRSGRELARRAGRSTTGVQYALDRLVEHGLISREQVGRTFLYTLNREHLLASTVELMAGARGELVRRLRVTIAAWGTPVVHASLFGSAARGDGHTGSDIDLLVVRPADVDPDDDGWRGQLDELASLVHHWTGNRGSIAEIAEGELSQLREERPPVLEELERDAVDLAGETARTLLGRL